VLLSNSTFVALGEQRPGRTRGQRRQLPVLASRPPFLFCSCRIEHQMVSFRVVFRNRHGAAKANANADLDRLCLNGHWALRGHAASKPSAPACSFLRVSLRFHRSISVFYFKSNSVISGRNPRVHFLVLSGDRQSRQPFYFSPHTCPGSQADVLGIASSEKCMQA